jgi:glycosyltransferase involved in cell wall biosynthesis
MRIAVYSDQFFPELSGVTDSLITTGEALRSKGHEVLYVAPRYSRHDYSAVQPKNAATGTAYAERQNLPVCHIPSIGIPGSPNGQARLAFPIGTTLKTVRRFRPDIIHTHQPFGVGVEAFFASRLLGVPLVGTNHTPIEQYIRGPSFLKPVLTWIARRFYAWYYNRCTYVSAPYPGLIADMREVGLTSAAGVVFNPVPLDLYTPGDDIARNEAKEKIGVSGPVVLYAGRLSPEKHIDVIIRAISELAQEEVPVTLVLAGHGSARTSLVTLTHELNLTARVRFLGFVDPIELARVYRAADVFSIASTAETFSLVLMQAYASGLPAIVTDSGALPHYAPPDCSQVVPVSDFRAFATSIRMFLGHKNQDHTRAVARAYVARFAPKAVAEHWVKIYRQVLAGETPD